MIDLDLQPSESSRQPKPPPPWSRHPKPIVIYPPKHDYPEYLGLLYHDPYENGGSSGGGYYDPPPQIPATPPPSWSVGTFYGRLSNGFEITLTVSPQGIVRASVGGGHYIGTLSGTTLFLNGDYSSVEQTDAGFRTRRLDSGTVTEYSRSTQPPQTQPPPAYAGGSVSPQDPAQNPSMSNKHSSPTSRGTFNIAGFEIETSTLLIVGIGLAAVVLLSGSGKK